MMMEDKGDRALPSDRAGGRCPEPAAQSQPSALIPSADEIDLLREDDDVYGGKSFAAFWQGKRIGRVYQTFPTFERKSRGKMYVNSRWRSKRQRWRSHLVDGRQWRTFYETKRRAIEELVAEFATVAAQAMSAGTAETQSGSGRQPASAVAEGHAPHPNQDTPHE